jgi:hypothetical protein
MAAAPASVLLHVQTDDPTFRLPGTGQRFMNRIVDYQYAAPGGLAYLVTATFPDAGDAEAAYVGDRATVFAQLWPRNGWLAADGVHEGAVRPSGTCVLSVIMDVEHDHLDAFHGWYDEEHLPKLCAVPGILAAVRYEAVAGDVGVHPRFLAWYELADRGVVESAAFAQASELTPRTAQVTAHLDWASQLYESRQEAP